MGQMAGKAVQFLSVGVLVERCAKLRARDEVFVVLHVDNGGEGASIPQALAEAAIDLADFFFIHIAGINSNTIHPLLYGINR